MAIARKVRLKSYFFCVLTTSVIFSKAYSDFGTGNAWRRRDEN